MFYILTDKVLKTAHIARDMSFMAEILGVHPTTITRRLPFWYDERYTLSQVGKIIKSNRGHNNLKKQKHENLDSER
jgi:hypothetical protein